jgi:hypothetical protein
MGGRVDGVEPVQARRFPRARASKGRPGITSALHLPGPGASARPARSTPSRILATPAALTAPLANGRSEETWVADRTGHRSSAMISKVPPPPLHSELESRREPRRSTKPSQAALRRRRQGRSGEEVRRKGQKRPRGSGTDPREAAHSVAFGAPRTPSKIRAFERGGARIQTLNLIMVQIHAPEPPRRFERRARSSAQELGTGLSGRVRLPRMRSLGAARAAVPDVVSAAPSASIPRRHVACRLRRGADARDDRAACIAIDALRGLGNAAEGRAGAVAIIRPDDHGRRRGVR